MYIQALPLHLIGCLFPHILYLGVDNYLDTIDDDIWNSGYKMRVRDSEGHNYITIKSAISTHSRFSIRDEIEFELYCDNAWKKGLLGTALFISAIIITLIMGTITNRRKIPYFITFLLFKILNTNFEVLDKNIVGVGRNY